MISFSEVFILFVWSNAGSELIFQVLIHLFYLFVWFKNAVVIYIVGQIYDTY